MTVKISKLLHSSTSYQPTSAIMPYSSAASIMTARDHPFNQSSRPLLAERKPQLLIKKKLSNKNAHNNHQNHNDYDHHDRDSLKVHGFNDFDIISQQYKSLNTHHIGYPYGSPPSPTANSNDFVFSDNANTNTNNFYSTSTPRGFVPPYSNSTSTGDRSRGDADYDDSCNYYSSVSKPSWFEDDFGWRTPPHFGTNGKTQTNYQPVGSKNNSNGGPFIFGVHHQQNNTSNSSYNSSKNSPIVINKNATNKYSSKNAPKSLSNSDTSSSSRDSGKESKLLVKSRKSSKKNSKDKKKSNNKEHDRPNIKCVVVGDGAVGKTNLIVSYLENRFSREHVPTASDIYNAQVMVNDSPVHVTLCDTAGQDTLDQLRELCYPDSDVFLLCFSVVKPDSFQSIKTKWAPKFSKTKAALILVGTQSDLRSDIHVLNKLQTQGEKPISFKDAWDLATSIGAKYIETSSFTQEKVKDVFDTAIWEALVPTTLPPTPPLWKKLLCLV